MSSSLLVAMILFGAVFVQSVTGFGSAMVAMALLPYVTGLQTAAPLYALAGALAELILLAYYRHAIHLGSLWRFTLAGILAVPFGILLLRAIPEDLALAAIGGVILAYAIYALAKPELPRLKRPAWAYGFGLLSGLFGGAYNVSGPPLIIFANSQRWPAARFKANLQAYFLIISLVISGGHLLAGNLTADVRGHLPLAAAAVVLAVWLGTRLDRRIAAEAFRKVTLWGLAFLGLGMVLLP